MPRGVPETIGGESCLSQYVTFDVGGDDLRISFWHLWLAAVGVLRGLGLCRMFRTVEADRKIFSRFS
jgi:hypothetical protein